MENRSPQKGTWSLISGILFIAIGVFRLYQHFFVAASEKSYTTILAVVFICYGMYRLYTYFGKK